MERIVVLGGGESGAGSAVLAKVKGFDVFLSDAGQVAPKYRQWLESYDIKFEEGGHTAQKILSADRVIKSPGIPDKAPIVAALRERAVPVISEIEFAGAFTDARTICITGSNGKTTTATMIYEVLRAGGYNVGLAGNIGDSFAYSVATGDYDWYVLELSSFQLDGMEKFRADIAVLTNITPDHLDRYDYDIKKYAASKFRIVQNQRAEDFFIYCTDDKLTAEGVRGRDMYMRKLPFSSRDTTGVSAFLNGGSIEVCAGGTGLALDTAKLQVRGVHNYYNAMAASLAGLAAGVKPEAISEALYAFAGVEHRLEPAGEIGGVIYINDSKATNVDSAWYALQSMDRPVVWIAGGTDKGNDYSALYEFTPRIKALVCMGVDNAKLKKAFEGRIPLIADTSSLEEAMDAAGKFAAAGDVVLLSPANASFDLFKNYEDRGRQFKQWVARHVNRNNMKDGK